MFKGRKIRRYWYALTRHAIGEIWMLHRVWDTQTPIARLRPYEIEPAVLERLIVAYKQKGYEFVSIEEAYARMSSRKKCKKFVAVTNVYDAATGEELDLADAKALAAEANAGTNMFRVVDGMQNCSIKGEKGMIYELTYTAVDYLGVVMIKKFYVEF